VDVRLHASDVTGRKPLKVDDAVRVSLVVQGLRTVDKEGGREGGREGGK